MRNAIILALASRMKAVADEAAKCARLARLVALREEGMPLAFAAQRRGHLGLEMDKFVSKEDGRRDVLGWWVETETAKKDGWRLLDGAPAWRRHSTAESCTRYFGVLYQDAVALFAMEGRSGGLDRRVAYLDFLLAEGIGGRLARAIVVAWARLRSRRRLRRLHKDGRISCGKPSSLFSR